MKTSPGNVDGKIHVAYFDDQLLFREALSRVLEDTGAVAVIQGSGHQGHDIRTLLDSPISVALVTLDAQTNDPMVTVRGVRQILPELPVCVLVALDRLNSTREALIAGCNGAVSTSASLAMLVAALESLARGQAFVDPMLGGRLISKTISRTAASRNSRGSLRGTFSEDDADISKVTGGKRVF
jgi:DNA-binding NarL/FixJ family response regulator